MAGSGSGTYGPRQPAMVPAPVPAPMPATRPAPVAPSLARQSQGARRAPSSVELLTPAPDWPAEAPALEDLPGEFPGDGAVTFEVACRTKPGTRGTRHPVTVHTDWTVEVPHDLELERIAAALGGAPVSCLALRDRIVPAIHDLWLHLARRAPVGIHPVDKGRRWTIAQPAPGCACADRPHWPMDEAGGHLRGLAHWARVHGVPAADVKAVLDAWQAARAGPDGGTPALPLPLPPPVPPPVVGGGAMIVGTAGAGPLSSSAMGGGATGPPTSVPVTRDDLFADACPMPAAMALLVPDPQEAYSLWLAGVHPEWALWVKRYLRASGPLTWTYLSIDARGVDLRWLATFVPYGASTVNWAARTYSRFDAAHPGARRAWLEAGFSYWTVDPLVGSPYRPADVLALARAIGLSPNLAADYLSGWTALRATPAIDHLTAVWALPTALRRAPTPEMLHRVADSCRGVTGHLETTDLALIVAACGSITAAGAFLRRHRPVSADAAIAILRRQTLGA